MLSLPWSSVTLMLAAAVLTHAQTLTQPAADCKAASTLYSKIKGKNLPSSCCSSAYGISCSQNRITSLYVHFFQFFKPSKKLIIFFGLKSTALHTGWLTHDFPSNGDRTAIRISQLVNIIIVSKLYLKPHLKFPLLSSCQGLVEL
jgi:hypothetical protein